MTDKLVWEQRWHPLREEWILYTSHRGGRPWLGEKKEAKFDPIPAYDPTCALCPGNKRLKLQNPSYTGAYWFTNDLPCFGSPDEVPPVTEEEDLIYWRRPAYGTAEVVCYHPDHGRTFADLTQIEAVQVVDLWAERYLVLGARDEVNHVLIFENKGALVGTSNPHPHCQIYASSMIYGYTEREVNSSKMYLQKHAALLGQAIVQREAGGPRVIAENADFLACVPWFARYAYEVLILPKAPASSLNELDFGRRSNLASLMIEVAIRYDNLWSMPMPYVMAIHQAPTDGADYHYYPFHIEYHPPLRKPDTMKYLAGPEIGGGSMTNESDPDAKAAELKSVSNRLYRTEESNR
jgi:UDPglucose--hexose-1-phosphate uridylyltransferase